MGDKIFGGRGLMQNALLGFAARHPQPSALGQTRWQERHAYPDWQQRVTRLTPEQERQFQAWALANRAPITPDYDMRGFWLHGRVGAQVNPYDRQLHYPDTWKTPLHESFSGESRYADPRTRPPRWNDRGQLIAPDGTILYDEGARR